MRSFAWTLVALLGVESLASARQQVWVVDDTPSPTTDFQSLQTAIDTVADGDVLLVRDGIYAGMLVHSKSLTIVADAGATPTVGAGVVEELAVNESVRLQGLAFASLRLQQCAGMIWVESCTAVGNPAIWVRGAETVALLDVTATGSPGGDCDASGSNGTALQLQRVAVRDCGVHCYGSTFTGGGGGTDWCISGQCLAQIGGRGIESRTATNFLMVSDCRVAGGHCSGLLTFCDGTCYSVRTCGGTGLDAAVGEAHVLDSMLSGGAGHDCTPFSDVPGEPFTGPVDFLPGGALRVTPLEPARENDTVLVHIEGPPHSLIRMGTSDAPGALPAVDLLRGTLLLKEYPPPQVRTLGVTNAAGVLDTTITLGTFAPGVEAEIAFYQFYYVQPERPHVRRFGQPLQDVVLGQATMLVGLDDSF